MIIVMEDIYDKVVLHYLLKKDNISKNRVQTILKSFSHFYLDLDFKNAGVDQRQIKALHYLKERYMVLTPYKEQRTVVVSKIDFYGSLYQLKTKKIVNLYQRSNITYSFDNSKIFKYTRIEG